MYKVFLVHQLSIGSDDIAFVESRLYMQVDLPVSPFVGLQISGSGLGVELFEVSAVFYDIDARRVEVYCDRTVLASKEQVSNEADRLMSLGWAEIRE